MANQNIIAEKVKFVAGIQQKVENAKSVVIADYRGFTVAEDTELRNEMRKAGVEYVVLKNSMVERACDAAGIDTAVKQYLKGPSAFAFGTDDPAIPAKTLKDFIKKVKKGAMKGGLIGKDVADAAQMDQLADIPPREVLLARLFGAMKAPITGLAVALQQIADKQAAPEAAPAEAAPEAAE